MPNHFIEAIMGNNNFSPAVVVFAKVPGLGIAKSRIAAACGRSVAEKIYLELLSETVRAVGCLPHHVAFTGQEDPGRLRDLFPNAGSFFPQHGATLGDRLTNACRQLFETQTHLCAIGCDCPSLQNIDIETAFTALEADADVVIGQAYDGGYYLAGCAPHSIAVFSATGWSTHKLFEETMEIIRRNGYRYRLLPRYADIDTIADYLTWKRGALS
jgi:rSAM/selenodomain-associated transferase 1